MELSKSEGTLASQVTSDVAPEGDIQHLISCLGIVGMSESNPLDKKRYSKSYSLAAVKVATRGM